MWNKLNRIVQKLLAEKLLVIESNNFGIGYFEIVDSN